jgi:hypothetical protein
VKHTRLKPPKDAKHEGGPCCRSGNQRNENREQGTPVTLVAPSFPRRNHEESRTKEETNRSPSSKESGPVEKNRSGQQCAKKHQPKSCGEQHALSIDHHWWFLNLPYSAGFHPEGILAAEDKGQSRKLPRVALVPHFRFPTATKWMLQARRSLRELWSLGYNHVIPTGFQFAAKEERKQVTRKLRGCELYAMDKKCAIRIVDNESHSVAFDAAGLIGKRRPEATICFWVQETKESWAPDWPRKECTFKSFLLGIEHGIGFGNELRPLVSVHRDEQQSHDESRCKNRHNFSLRLIHKAINEAKTALPQPDSSDQGTKWEAATCRFQKRPPFFQRAPHPCPSPRRTGRGRRYRSLRYPGLHSTLIFGSQPPRDGCPKPDVRSANCGPWATIISSPRDFSLVRRRVAQRKLRGLRYGCGC